MPIRSSMAKPSQYAEKFPATKPERMLSDGPPSREAVTISATCRDLVEVNTLTNSGMSAPARVPQEMTVESFHHSDVSPTSSGIMNALRMKVRMIDRIEVSQTRVVR